MITIKSLYPGFWEKVLENESSPNWARNVPLGKLPRSTPRYENICRNYELSIVIDIVLPRGLHLNHLFSWSHYSQTFVPYLSLGRYIRTGSLLGGHSNTHTQSSKSNLVRNNKLTRWTLSWSSLSWLLASSLWLSTNQRHSQLLIRIRVTMATTATMERTTTAIMATEIMDTMGKDITTDIIMVITE